MAHTGYRGMWATMWRAFSQAKQHCRADWVILLENDADFRLDQNWHKTLREFTVKTPDARVVWLDHRRNAASDCCTVAVAYHRTILDQMILDFSYTTAQVDSVKGHITQVGSGNKQDAPYWKDYTDHGGKCLTDWYLADLLAFRGIPNYNLGIVYHPGQGGSGADGLPSEIENVSEEAKKARRTRALALQQLQEKMMSFVAEGNYAEAAEVKKEIERIGIVETKALT